MCIECVVAWLLFGDGATCLAGHGRVYLAALSATDTKGEA